MTNRKAFENWYIQCYGSLFGVWYDEPSESYSTQLVDIAWKAWCAGQEESTPRFKSPFKVNDNGARIR